MLADELHHDLMIINGKTGTLDSLDLIHIEPDFVKITAIKRSEDDPKSITIRLYNARNEQINAKISLGAQFQVEKIFESDLIELIKKEIKVVDPKNIEIKMGPHEITTLIMRLKI